MAKLITEELMPALQGYIPSMLSTSSLDGIPNCIAISQVYYYDDQHLALSKQFFSKTWLNIEENPKLCIIATCPQTMSMWKIKLIYAHEESEGDYFDKMDMKLEAIASMIGKEGVFKLASAVVCKLESVEKIYDSNVQ